jgi:glycosyltransferase involved in cell wall biosynthesis
MTGAPRSATVVIATYNRTESLVRLLRELAEQRLSGAILDVVVIDDGSAVPVELSLRPLRDTLPYQLTLLTQANAGPGAARHAGIAAASGDVIVIIDDDMRVRPDFVKQHLAAHVAGTRRVVLGALRHPADDTLPLFERYQMAMLQKLYDSSRDGVPVRGWNLYTGNVSFRRADYLAVGGFDRTLRLSEDAELGMRLEASGVEFLVSHTAATENATDHASVRAWMKRSYRYGQADARIADKHPTLLAANPWRFLDLLNPVSRPCMYLAARTPWLMRPVAWAALAAAHAAAAVGAERVAIAGMTFVYGIQYYRGVRAFHGEWSSTAGSLRWYREQRDRTTMSASATSSAHG